MTRFRLVFAHLMHFLPSAIGLTIALGKKMHQSSKSSTDLARQLAQHPG
jgi:hypothetical protein